MRISDWSSDVCSSDLVLSLLDPGWPELDAFQGYGPHHRTTLHFNDIIEAIEGRVAPTPADVAEILRFGADIQASSSEREANNLLVHCHMGCRARRRRC